MGPATNKAFLAFVVALCFKSVLSWDPYLRQFIRQNNFLYSGFPVEDEAVIQDVASDRIFKGWFLRPHEFPWMVKLKVK